ncbi:phospholipid carrier-dependent glycosyltransferase [Paenibacillus thermoaerophilus]|uniref:Polyprenol-phosphate-mannose--protein mannosyltransferase n=2 Tax=Paenibacillus thermoaerophilus TaxID=1215385 RepID=A0ABW2UYA1_9BACL
MLTIATVAAALAGWTQGAAPSAFAESPSAAAEVQSGTAGNLLTNGDFQQSTAGVPAGWGKDVWQTDGLASQFAVESQPDGNAVAIIVNDKPNDAKWTQTVTVEPNATYLLTGRVKTEGVGEAAVGANLSVLGILETSEDVRGTTEDWRTLSFYGRTGKDQREVTIAARLGGYGSLNTGKAIFDDIRLEKVEQPPSGAKVVSLIPAPVHHDGGGEAKTQPMKALRFNSLLGYSFLFVVLFLWLYRRFVSPGAGANLSGRSSGTGAGRWGAALAVTLVGAFVMRVWLSLSVEGHPADISTFKAWAIHAATVGIPHFYDDARFLGGDFFADYPPGYLYVLYAIGKIARAADLGAGSNGFLLLMKLPALLADLATAWLLYRWGRERVGAAASWAIAALYAFNPAVLLNGAVWGQVDSVFALFVAAAVYALGSGRIVAAFVVYAVAVLIKPQALIFAPVLLLSLAENFRLWKRYALGAGAGAAVFALLSLPFSPGKPWDWMIQLYTATLASYPYATLNAFNLMALTGGNWAPLDQPWMGLTYGAWGMILIVATVALAAWFWLRGKPGAKDKGELIAVLILACVFVLTSKMHERYLFPALVLASIAFIRLRDWRILGLYAAFSVAHFLNTGYVLGENLNRSYQVGANDGILVLVSAVHVGLLAVLIGVAGDILLRGRVRLPAGVRSRPETLKHAPRANGKAAGSVGTDWLRPETPPPGMTRKDYALMGGLTLVYAVIALINLGSFSAPETYWKPAMPGASVRIDLGSVQTVDRIYSYAGAGTSKYRVELSADGFNWGPPHEINNDYTKDFIWQIQTIQPEQARYARVTVAETGSALHELALFAPGGEKPLPAVSALGEPEGEDGVGGASQLIDEAGTVPLRPSYLHGTYFDEIYHARTAYEHLHKIEPYENTHPPLGKVFISAGIAVFGMNPFGWRIVGTLFGIAMVPLMYLFGKALFRKTEYAFIAAFLFTFDFMHFAQTRIATIDVYGVFFIILMFYFMLRYMQTNFHLSPLRRTLVPLGLSGLFFGIGAASKWIVIYGGAGLAFLFFYSLLLRWREYRTAKALLTGDSCPADAALRERIERIVRIFPGSVVKTLLWCVLTFVLIPVVIYVASYAQILQVPGYDLEDVWENQKGMFNYHSQLETTHPFGSSWWEWPFMYKPIWFYDGQGLPDDRVSSISSFGNPLVWWCGMGALFWVIYRMWTRRDWTMLVPFTAFTSQYVPWMLVPRLTFIYHFFAMVPFLCLFLTAFIKHLRENADAPAWWKRRMGRRIGAGRDTLFWTYASRLYLAGVLLLFVLFYPILSGLEVPKWYVAHVLRWFDSWYFY